MTSKDGRLNVEDAARALGAHRSRVLAALTSGAVPAEKVGRGRFRVAVADLDQLAAALGSAPRRRTPTRPSPAKAVVGTIPKPPSRPPDEVPWPKPPRRPRHR